MPFGHRHLQNTAVGQLGYRMDIRSTTRIRNWCVAPVQHSHNHSHSTSSSPAKKSSKTGHQKLHYCESVHAATGILHWLFLSHNKLSHLTVVLYLVDMLNCKDAEQKSPSGRDVKDEILVVLFFLAWGLLRTKKMIYTLLTYVSRKVGQQQATVLW
jgi:hypothetical protein